MQFPEKKKNNERGFLKWGEIEMQDVLLSELANKSY